MNKILFALSLAASAIAAPECPPLGSPSYLLPHDTDCTKFYICAHGTPLLQTCPDGTHFNAMFMVCQNPVFAGCDRSPPESELPCNWPDSILFHPHPETCSKYYVCEYGSSIVFDCPQGLEFNAELRECVWPHESNCNISQDGTNDGGSQTSGSQNGGSQNGGSQDGCQSDALSSHEECNKYYLCAHGVNVEMDCPSGLQWSSKVEQCVWPHESDCGSQDGAKTEEQNVVEGGAQYGGSQNDVSQDGCQSDALSSHEECNKFYLCAHGVNIEMDCPSGLQWSSKVEQCAWPHESDCGSQDDAKNDEQNGDEQNGDKQNGAENNGPCVNGALSAHEDCGKYNICNHGAPLAMDCPAGLHWNSNLSYCDWPVSAGCQE